jgi:sporulation protein YlmC with PRC-barrel domain
MRRLSIVLSVLVLAAMILTACGGEETSTSIPTQNIPPVTTEVTATTEATETATEAPVEATATGTPETSGIPVTGGLNSDRLSNELKYVVLDQSGKQVGKVDDMVLDLSKAKVLYVVVNADGKKIPVPWAFLKVGPASASSYPNEQQMAFTLQADTNTLKNAPVLDPKNVPDLGAEPDSWDISFRKYWEAGGTTSGNNTPVPVGTAVTDMTATATSSSAGTGTGLVTSTPTTSAGTSLATSTPATSAGTGQATGTGQGATGIQGVQLASKVIGAKVTVGVEVLEAGTPTASPGGAGTTLSTATPSTSGAGTSAATATPTTSGTSLATATPTSAALATSAPSTSTTAKKLNASITDLIVNTDSGEIIYIVIKTNFNDGEHLIPVPLALFSLDSNNEAFVLKSDAAMLQNAPSFQENQFPDMTLSGWTSEFNTFWQNNGNGTGLQATATATP